MSKAAYTPWEQLTKNALGTMEILGNFGPTSRHDERAVKGYMASDYGDDGRTYFNSADLRLIAAGCNEVADWLDNRAAIAKAIGEQA